MDDVTLSADGQNSDGAPVSLRVAPLASLWQFAGWDGFAVATDAAAKRLDLSLPEDFRTSRRSAGRTLWRIAPDRALIAAEAHIDAPEASPGIAALDLSYARVRLTLDGAGAAGLLARLTPVDTALAAFPEDTFAQTGIHHVGVLIDRRAANRFDVLVPRTWVRSVAGAMKLHLTP